MSFSEKELQNYIWDNRENFFNLINIPEEVESYSDLSWKCETWQLLYNGFIKQYMNSFGLLSQMELFGVEVSLPKHEQSDIRSDLIGHIPEEGSIVICELKKNKLTERQAYTELLAYANSVRGSFSPMGRQDVLLILISPMQERIVQEATINTILYDRNRVIALIPEGDDLESLRFNLWIPNPDEFKVITDSSFAPNNFEVVKMCWEDNTGVWSPSDKEVGPDSEMINRLNHVALYASQKMEEYGINGFVFCTQDYPAIRTQLGLENSIVVSGINPYRAAKTKLLFENGTDIKTASTIDCFEISLYNLFPSLRNERNRAVNDSVNYWGEMELGWSNNLWRIITDVLDTVTMSVPSRPLHSDHGGMTWSDYLSSSSEDKYCFKYDIILTGLLREVYESYVRTVYKETDEITLNKFVDKGLLEKNLIDNLFSQKHVRRFLDKMVPQYCPSKKEDEALEFSNIEFHPNAFTEPDEEIDDDLRDILDSV